MTDQNNPGTADDHTRTLPAAPTTHPSTTWYIGFRSVGPPPDAPHR